jgi:hypothetical protein
MKVNLHIERLILDGLPLESRHGGAVKAAIEQELSRLYSTGRTDHYPSGGAAVPSVRASEIQVTGQGGHSELGRQIAGSIYGAIGKEI